MAYAAQVFGELLGGVGEEAYSRDEDLESAWDDMGRRPYFAVTRPRLINRRFGEWICTFRYIFASPYPWTPELLIRQFQDLYADVAHPHAVMAQVVAEIEEISGRAEAPYPTGAAATDEMRVALPNILNHSVRIWSTRLVPPALLAWASVRAMLDREDHYDVTDGIERQYGNRMSRLVLKVREYTIPRGQGIEDARKSLGLTQRSLVDIKAAAPLCGQACLAYAIADETTRGHMRSRASTANSKAITMAERLGLDGPMALGDFVLFAESYPGHRAVVMGSKTEVLFVASGAGMASRTVYLLLHEAHYYYITDIDLFSRPTERSRARWCHACLASYQPAKLRNHACLQTCSCGATFASKEAREEHIQPVPPSTPACPKCEAPYLYNGCIARHKCRRWRCPLCQLSYPPSRKGASHVCRERYCEPCRCYFGEEAGHRCYVRPLKARAIKPEEKTNYWALDLECARGPAGEQVVTIGVAKRLYDGEVVVCRSADALYAFLDARGAGATFLSHNGAKYDTFLIYHLLLLKSPVVPVSTFVGLKLLKLTWKGATFLDSYRHLGMSLGACARSFGLPAGKGYFPYDFYTLENVAYSGEPPPRHTFTEAVQASPDFAAWYDDLWARYLLLDAPYDIEEECVRYCVQDVDILAAVLEKYRDAGVVETRVDPYTKATIAAYAMATYRTGYLPAGRVAMLQPDEDDFARRALKGGRTDARQVMRAWTAEEVAAGSYGRYADINSLYPWVLRNCPLPVGEPSWEPRSSFEEPHAYLTSLPADAVSLVECDVTCPSDLHHPVLVSTDADGRLRATLLPKERQVFTSAELQAALSHGYTVTRIYSALRFAATTGELFAAYIDYYYELKRRAGAAGDKAAYALAKMMMNSLWGKFAQRPAEGEIITYKDPQRWYQDLSLAACGKITLDVKVTCESYLIATKGTATKRLLDTTNAALAAFVTSHARLKLYTALSPLGQRVIYHDTDSVIYEGLPNETLIEYGDALGQWKDECAGSPIVQVCCLGPKTYAYRRADAVSVVKSKGFSSPFTLEQYWGCASQYFAGVKERLTQPDIRFNRRLGSGIAVQPSEKTMMPLMDKLMVISPTLTLPRGHKDA